MSGLLYRIRVAVLAHVIFYTPLALWLAHEDHAQITVLIVPPLGLTLAMIWFGRSFWTALTDVHAILTARRPASLADYMPGTARPDVNRAA